MCTRFVHNGKDTINGFNFEIDLAVWEHAVIKEKDLFFIGIKGADDQYHSYHGVNRNGNVVTLLYVHGNEVGAYSASRECYTIADLTEQFIKNKISLDDALDIVKNKKIVYAPDATMQSMLSDRSGRALIIEPGIGYRIERERYSLITNYSLLKPETTKPYIVPGDDRYERTKALLEKGDENFTAEDALGILKRVSQEGEWATRVSFVCSAKEQRVCYVVNNGFGEVFEYVF